MLRRCIVGEVRRHVPALSCGGIERLLRSNPILDASRYESRVGLFAGSSEWDTWRIYIAHSPIDPLSRGSRISGEVLVTVEDMMEPDSHERGGPNQEANDTGVLKDVGVQGEPGGRCNRR